MKKQLLLFTCFAPLFAHQYSTKENGKHPFVFSKLNWDFVFGRQPKTDNSPHDSFIFSHIHPPQIQNTFSDDNRVHIDLENLRKYPRTQVLSLSPVCIKQPAHPFLQIWKAYGGLKTRFQTVESSLILWEICKLVPYQMLESFRTEEKLLTSKRAQDKENHYPPQFIDQIKHIILLPFL